MRVRRGGDGQDPFGRDPARPSPALPPELAFLPEALVPLTVLDRVARKAESAQVTAEVTLLTEGHLAADRYYRQLAVHLGLPFAERPLRPASGVAVETVLSTGLLKLAPNAHGWHALLAPGGLMLREILSHAASIEAPIRAALAITSPDRIEALIRQDRRHDVAHAASHALPDWNGSLSAKSGLTARQSLCCAAATLGLCAGAWLVPAACLDALALIFSLAFLLAVSVRLAATAASPPPRPAGPEARWADRDLPLYTIVAPLYREAREVDRLIAALDRLDYPRSKLDIILMIEANDRSTLDAIERRALPFRYKTVMAPAGRPQTKPRALNVALQFARGAFLVVYDAEDEPEPRQLRDAVARFAAEPTIACLQAKLAIDNCDDSWLTRLFTLEYAALFHVVNPGLANLGLPIPLGGTSNHFRLDVLRRVNGWDAWNVTEDIDLGIRLARFGYRVGTLDSVTFEEAPNRLKPWLGQRCRWQKGWMVTLATHSRAPFRTWRDLGLWGGLAVWAMLFGTIASCLLGPFFAVMAALRLWSGELLHPQSEAEAAWSALSCFLLTIGLVSAIWPVLLGLRRRDQMRLGPWTATLPVYFLLLSLAAWQAAFEAAGRPHVWVKTEHGRAKRRLGSVARRSL